MQPVQVWPWPWPCQTFSGVATGISPKGWGTCLDPNEVLWSPGRSQWCDPKWTHPCPFSPSLLCCCHAPSMPCLHAPGLCTPCSLFLERPLCRHTHTDILNTDICICFPYTHAQQAHTNYIYIHNSHPLHRYTHHSAFQIDPLTHIQTYSMSPHVFTHPPALCTHSADTAPSCPLLDASDHWAQLSL